jgi:hypothetical protein
VDERAILQALRIKGWSTATQLAAATCQAEDVTAKHLSSLLDECLVESGARGFRLTEEGRSLADQLFHEDKRVLGGDALALYDAFGPFNEQIKQAVTDWQLKPSDGEEPVLNDHGDEGYDASVIARLEKVHHSCLPMLEEISGLLGRFSVYTSRLQAAMEGIRAGQTELISSPIKDSYHSVWFELHQDLILSTGRTRAAEAEAGRG